jgi:hypothetical protein
VQNFESNLPDTLEHRTAFALPFGDQKVRTKTRARSQLIWKIPLWIADGKNRPPPYILNRKFRKTDSLELAKGFEPLTL